MKDTPIYILILLGLAFTFYFLSQNAFAQEEYDRAADSFCEYAQLLYEEGDISDATHELNKALQVNPNNRCAQKLLKKISKSKKGKAVIKPVPAPPAISIKPVATEPGKCNRFTFDGTESYDPDGQVLSYLWDFGDNTTSTEPVVTHTYEKAGDYTVTLTVKDASGLKCDTASSTKNLEVNTPPVPNFTFPENVCTAEAVIFNASSTVDNTPENLSYAWDFADGTKATGPIITKAYTKSGTYKVTLLVNDNTNTFCNTAAIEKTIKVNSPPSANAGKDINMCVKPDQELRVTLDAGGSRDPDGDALTYTWDFGDGTKGTGKSVEHLYNKSGKYNVVLSVSDGKEPVCPNATDSVSVNLNRQPVADAGKNMVCCFDTESVFDGSNSKDPDGDVLTYTWDFGDGSRADGAKVTHSYAKRGTYTVKLTVNDNTGTPCGVNSDSFEANVYQSPVSIIKVR